MSGQAETLTLEEAISRQRQLIEEGFEPHALPSYRKAAHNMGMLVIAMLFRVDSLNDERIKAAMI